MLEINTYCAFIVPCITYYFRNELEMILRLNNEKNYKKSIGGENKSQWLKKCILWTYFWTAFSIVSLLPLYLSIPALTNDKEYFLNVKSYIYPNPFAKKIKSTFEFEYCNILIFCCQTSIMVPVSLTPGIMILIIAYEFYLSFECWCHRLAEYSAKFKRSLDELNKKYSHDKLRKFEYKRAVETERRQFMNNIIGLTRDFQVKMR